MNAKINYVFCREFALDKARAIRLLAALGNRPEANESITDWRLGHATTIVGVTKSFRVHADEMSGDRIQFNVEVDEDRTVQGNADWLDVVKKADERKPLSIRKALVPFARLTRLGSMGQYRVRNEVEFQDLMAFHGIELSEVAEPAYPALIASAPLEVKRVSVTTLEELRKIVELLGESDDRGMSRGRGRTRGRYDDRDDRCPDCGRR